MLTVIILHDESRVDVVLRALVELELYDTTVLDGESVEALAVRTVPVFESLGGWFGENRAYNRAILVSVRDRAEVDAVVRLCRADGLDLTDPAIACILMVPAERYTAGTPPGGFDASA